MEGRGSEGLQDENPWGKPERSATLSKKFSDKFGKTKDAMTKFKRGTKLGVNWIKLKCKLSRKKKADYNA